MNKILKCPQCDTYPLIKPYSLEYNPLILVKCNCAKNAIINIETFLSKFCISKLNSNNLVYLVEGKCTKHKLNKIYICRNCSDFFCSECYQYHSNHDFYKCEEVNYLVNIQKIKNNLNEAKQYNSSFLPKFMEKVKEFVKDELPRIKSTYQRITSNNQNLMQLIQILMNNYFHSKSKTKVFESINLLNFTEFNKPFENQLDKNKNDYTFEEIQKIQKIIIVDSVSIYNLSKPLPFFKDSRDEDVYYFSVFQEGKLGCLMCNGLLKIFDPITMKCEFKARIWNHMLPDHSHFSEIETLREYHQRGYDYEDVRITQLPNKLIIIYSTFIDAWKISANKLIFLGEFLDLGAVNYQLTPLEHNRICIREQTNVIKIREAFPPFRELFSLRVPNSCSLYPVFQLTNEEILITGSYAAINSWDLRTKETIGKLGAASLYQEIMKLDNNKILCSKSDDSYEIVDGKTFQIETILKFDQNLRFDDDEKLRIILFTDGSIGIINQLGKLFHFHKKSYKMDYNQSLYDYKKYYYTFLVRKLIIIEDKSGFVGIKY